MVLVVAHIVVRERQVVGGGEEDGEGARRDGERGEAAGAAREGHAVRNGG